MLKGERAQRRKERETINTIDHREENREMLFVRRHRMKAWRRCVGLKYESG